MFVTLPIGPSQRHKRQLAGQRTVPDR